MILLLSATSHTYCLGLALSTPGEKEIHYRGDILNPFWAGRLPGARYGRPRSLEVRSSTYRRILGWCTPRYSRVGLLIHTIGRVIYSVFLMHRRKDLWGPDGTPSIEILSPVPRVNRIALRVALDFDPDRFLDERLHRYLTPNPFIFLPFNAGRRICLGQQVGISSFVIFVMKTNRLLST